MPSEFHPVDQARWPDFQRFFAAHGNTNYCWCTLWRTASSEYRHAEAADRQGWLHELVRDGQPVGVLGYVDGEPMGWCSVAPREAYPRLERSYTIPSLEGDDVWSVACFFVDPSLRKSDFTVDLLRAATEYARSEGAGVVEGYPVEAGSASYRFMGYRPIFEAAGFVDVTPEGSKRRVVRFD